RTDEIVATEDPARILDLVSQMAWGAGDPGLLFVDRINDDNPTPGQGQISATNPCGEVPLLPYEACVLGSINLGHHTDGDAVDWEKLRETVHLGIRLLDDAIEVSTFPIPEIEEAVARNRKVGLGLMGFHDMLVDLGIPYDSDDAVAFSEELMAFVHEEAWAASATLAEKRGPFPAWEDSVHEEPVRNATTTSIAPTGTISMIAGCSASVEPIYNVAYTKQVLGGLDIVSDRFVEIAKERGFYSESLMEDVHGRTSIQDVDAVPDDATRLFQTAHDVPPERHVEIQAALQAHVDNAVSKTVNLPREASVEDVEEIFLLARELDVKGITVFRSGARPEQVLGEDPLKEECVSECEYVAEPGE
ncbi:MAG TPA: adenosylcobalamin-dependent ribonucleoside-diphosphate reductase, partial [Halobacteriales archaeon]|nr:adenosylcobalamin-dependent ribonucleoside-diphosphate reductase [Halobacteriales archaeon]